MGPFERNVAGLLSAIALVSVAALGACSSDDSGSLTGGLVNRETQGGEQLLPDGGIAPGQPGSDLCATGGVKCGDYCIDTSTDVNNCGSCGTVCGSTCALGRCVVTLAPAQGSTTASAPAAIGLSSANVYYFGAAGLMSVPVGGGTPVAVGPGGSGAIAVGASSVFYFGPGSVMSVPLSGGPAVALSPGSGYALTANSVGVCWTTASGTVKSIPLDGVGDGGTPETLATGQDYCDGIVANESHVYWTTNGSLSGGGGFSPQTGTVEGLALSAPVDAGAEGGADAGADSGSAIVLASAQNYPTGIAIDSANVYWAASGTSANSYGDGAIMSAPLAGGPAKTLVSGQSYPYGIAVDATNVYWTNNASGGKSGTVMSVALGGGTPVTLAAGLSSPWSVAVDATSVYWTSGDGSVMKLSPKK